MPLNSHPEKRQFPRYAAEERALIRLNSMPETSYHLVDISCGGLAFRYLGEKREKKNIVTVSLGDDDHVFLENIPVTTITDISIPSQSTKSRGKSIVPRRRASLQFTELTTEQERRLKKFIKTYTVGSA